ncbi:Hairy/enhancer-of-split with YRPW motif protein 2, variant 2 [Pleurotus ostreatus]|nr:Hairy/enhancer-of-split with YRPW motif protein 2, variant 2 [Pleurotus ostreatus]
MYSTPHELIFTAKIVSCSFSYETVVKRWPVIITGIIDRLCRINHDLTLEIQQALQPSSLPDAQAKITESKGIIEQISKLKYHMGRDHPLEPLVDDTDPMIKTYNEELELLAAQGKNTWFTAPWLYAECYLYYLLRSLFSKTQHWREFDPFFSQKMDMFKQSRVAILQLAKTMKELEVDHDMIQTDPSKLAVLFKEMIQMCLWGNATDLSLLTHLTQSDIEHLQTVGKDAQTARKEFILRDDQEAAWKHLETLHNSRIDFVLDNAGFELFTDFVFADFLVSHTPFVSSVVFHPKLIPWFVSDVTPPDFSVTISSLLDPSFFPPPTADETVDPSLYSDLFHMVSRWQKYVDDGTFKLSVPLNTPLGAFRLDSTDSNLANFWTSPYPYWDMESRAPLLWKSLSESGLVIFKGDLNYRKLTGDVKWPAWTPFNQAVGPLAGSFPLLSLRTNKADVVVGVDKDIAQRLDQSDEKWRVNGRYALISFLPKS